MPTEFERIRVKLGESNLSKNDFEEFAKIQKKTKRILTNARVSQIKFLEDPRASEKIEENTKKSERIK